MKMSRIISLLLVLVMLASCFVACGPKDNGGEQNQNNGDDLSGTYNITIWASELEGVAEQFQTQIDAFEKANPGIIINATIEAVKEADAGSQVVADVAAAPDMYCFAQDQLARLVQAAALATPPSKVADAIKSSNDAGAVAAATVGGKLYAYPMTSDNGFYMFYDKSIFPNAADLDSMEKIIEICEANNKTFRFPLENGWYNAGFFFATGCSSTWTVDDKGTWTAVNDTYNSDAGLVAMKGMEKLAKSSCYNSDNETLTDIGVIVTGTWAANSLKEVLGDNYAATDLPSFEVDGKSYHLGSMTGNKLIGVKPQKEGEEKKAAVLALLAQYLTGAECQKQRFDVFGWGPSNLTAQQSPEVQADPALAAFALQAQYGIPQGQIHGDWWDIAAALGAQAKDAETEQDLKDSLTGYEVSVKALLNK